MGKLCAEHGQMVIFVHANGAGEKEQEQEQEQ